MRWLLSFFQPHEVGLFDSAIPPQDAREERAFKISAEISEIKRLQSDSPKVANAVIDRVHRLYWYYKEAVASKDSDRAELYKSYISDKRFKVTAAAGVSGSFAIHFFNNLSDATMSLDSCIKPQAYMSQSSQMVVFLFAILGLQAFFRLNFEKEKTEIDNAVINYTGEENYYKTILEGLGRNDLLKTEPVISQTAEVYEAAFAPH